MLFFRIFYIFQSFLMKYSIFETCFSHSNQRWTPFKNKTKKNCKNNRICIFDVIFQKKVDFESKFRMNLGKHGNIKFKLLEIIKRLPSVRVIYNPNHISVFLGNIWEIAFKHCRLINQSGWTSSLEHIDL